MNTDTQTRKDEIRYHTDDFDKAVGKFLASAVVKTWQEDFTDASTGEVIKIDRTEIIAERGKYIDANLAQSLKFHVLCGDITDIEVSNQRRIAKPITPSGLYPFRVNAQVGNKRVSFILQAQTPAKAIDVATDYIELNYNDDFGITAVKQLDRVIILNDTLISAEEAAAIAANSDGNEDIADRADVKYYKVEVDITVKSDTQNYPINETDTFIVRTKDVDTAKAVIRAWIEAKLQHNAEQDGDDRQLTDMAIQAAAPFSCNAIISREFCLAYRETEE